MNQTSKVYVPKSSAKEKVFDDGGSIIKLGFKADEFVEFINANKNAKGYIKLTVSKRRTPSQYGDTHSVALDSFVPKGEANSAPSNQPDLNDQPPF